MTDFHPLEYLSVLKRRKVVFFSVFGAVFFLSLVFAFSWSRYVAYATVEVARPEIAMDTVDTGPGQTLTPEAMADFQISRLKQQVFSTGSLADIIAKLNLYPAARSNKPIAYIAKDMRDHINIQLVGTSLANPVSAQKATASQLSAIAFVLRFEYSDPQLAQKTVNELVSRFLDEDLKERREMAQKTSDFLEGQIDMLANSLEEQERKIAEFRAENGDIRPDALAFNQQASATTSSRLLSIESDLISNLGLIGALRAQLAQTEPYARVVDESGEVLTTPSIQLRALKSQYATLTAKYGPEHPDVIKVSRQIDALESDVDPVSFTARLKAKIADANARLETMRSAYGPEHPDFITLQNTLHGLEQQLAKAEKSKAKALSGAVRKDADNPAYLHIVAQLEAAEKQQSALEKQRDEVRAQQQEYQRAVAANPATEQKMAALARDYDNMIAMYRDLKARKLSADMSRTIEEGHVGRRLAVIDPPELPLDTEPSRKLIMAAGLLLALMAGLGSVFGLQALSLSVAGPRQLESQIGAAPLVSIPRLRTLDEKIRRRKILRLDSSSLRDEQSRLSAFEAALDRHHIVAHRAPSKEADLFRFLRTQILQSMGRNDFKTIAISSPRYSDGKSTVASNLAVSIAQDLKQTVLMVDLDLRKPSLADYLDIKIKAGLTDYLAGKASVKDCLVRLPFERISVFPAGKPVDRSSETLGSPQMQRLATELKERYDDRLIIYDMPPLLEQDDPLVFLPHVDTFLLVIREGVTTIDEVRRSLDILQAAKVIGIALNEA